MTYTCARTYMNMTYTYARLGEDDVPDARPLRGDGLLLDASDGQHAPRQAELAWGCTGVEGEG